MRLLNNSRGVAIIYVTLFLLVLGMLFVALGIDVGWMAYVRTQGQASVDAAALRGAAAIPSYNASNGDPAKVNALATSIDADNTVMNQDSGTVASSSVIEVCSGGPAPGDLQCPAAGAPPDVWGTAVRVTRTFPTPLFLSRVIMGSAGASTNITVSSTAFLGGVGEGQPDIPVALRGCKVGWPQSCNAPRTIQSPETQDNSFFTIFDQTGNDTCKKMAAGTEPIPVVHVGDEIKAVGSGQADSCLADLKDRYCIERTGNKNCDGEEGPWCVTMPVTDCPSADTGQGKDSGTVVGFATMCITNIQDGRKGTPKLIAAELGCNFVEQGPSGGQFFGTYANRPVLVR